MTRRSLRVRQTIVVCSLAVTLPTALLLAAGPAETVPPPVFPDSVKSIFFDDARQKLGPGQPGAVRAAPAAGAPSGGGMPSGGGPAMAGGSGENWSQIISSESLEAEVKAQLPKTQESVQTLTGFKGMGHHQARITYSYLAVLFEVIARYDGDVRWKSAAPGVRDRFSQVGFNCKTSSDASFNEAKLRSQDFADLLGGQTPDLPASPEATMPLGKVAARPPLMTRMEVSRAERLGLWSSDQASFSQNKDNLVREAEALGMLAKVIQDPDFEFGDDDTYLGYAADLEKQCKALADAVKLDNLDSAQKAVSAISRSCDACHGDYR